MILSEYMRAVGDHFRLNRYGLKKYLIPDGKKHPFALICPGGGYSMVCSFVEGEPYAKALNKLGYSAFVVYYSVRKRACFPAPQQDVAKALQDILSHAEEWNLHTDCYSLWGSSAGGHLAATFGTESMGYAKYNLPKPGALILAYPVISMGEKTHPGSRENLLGNQPQQELIQLTSVENQVTEAYPPTFIWCGDADRTVDPANSALFIKALEEKGVPHQYETYANVDHGVGLGKGLACEAWFEHAVRFWDQQRK